MGRLFYSNLVDAVVLLSERMFESNPSSVHFQDGVVRIPRSAQSVGRRLSQRRQRSPYRQLPKSWARSIRRRIFRLAPQIASHETEDREACRSTDAARPPPFPRVCRREIPVLQPIRRQRFSRDVGTITTTWLNTPGFWLG